MTNKYKSPLAPKKINKIKAIAGVDLYTFSAGLYNKDRSDIALFIKVSLAIWLMYWLTFFLDLFE